MCIEALRLFLSPSHRLFYTIELFMRSIQHNRHLFLQFRLPNLRNSSMSLTSCGKPNLPAIRYTSETSTGEKVQQLVRHLLSQATSDLINDLQRIYNVIFSVYSGWHYNFPKRNKSCNNKFILTLPKKYQKKGQSDQLNCCWIFI